MDFLAISFLFLFIAFPPLAEPGFLTSPDESQVSAVAAQKAIGRQLENFALIDQDGKKFEIKEFFDKPFLITFIYTTCPVICPNLLLAMEGVVQKAGERFGRDFRVITVAFDVENDTPEILKTYGESLTGDFANWKFLTTKSIQAMRDFTRMFGFRYKKAKEGWDHLMLTVAVGKEGIIMANFLTDRYDADEALKAVYLTGPRRPAFYAGLKTFIASSIIAAVIFAALIYFYVLRPLKRKKEIADKTFLNP
ncbi:MAG: SCO family protein [Nitrospinae bacterium]|nr:SCO family protein [Nitrospinota bacterium]